MRACQNKMALRHDSRSSTSSPANPSFVHSIATRGCVTDQLGILFWPSFCHPFLGIAERPGVHNKPPALAVELWASLCDIMPLRLSPELNEYISVADHEMNRGSGIASRRTTLLLHCVPVQRTEDECERQVSWWLYSILPLSNAWRTHRTTIVRTHLGGGEWYCCIKESRRRKLIQIESIHNSEWSHGAASNQLIRSQPNDRYLGKRGEENIQREGGVGYEKLSKQASFARSCDYGRDNTN